MPQFTLKHLMFFVTMLSVALAGLAIVLRILDAAQASFIPRAFCYAALAIPVAMCCMSPRYVRMVTRVIMALAVIPLAAVIVNANDLTGHPQTVTIVICALWMVGCCLLGSLFSEISELG